MLGGICAQSLGYSDRNTLAAARRLSGRPASGGARASHLSVAGGAFHSDPGPSHQSPQQRRRRGRGRSATDRGTTGRRDQSSLPPALAQGRAGAGAAVRQPAQHRDVISPSRHRSRHGAEAAWPAVRDVTTWPPDDVTLYREDRGINRVPQDGPQEVGKARVT